ncbi:uncharacterized protein TM35_000641210 [Trypanosoma theileri]|uniref:Mucin TcMUCII n=1 Tax=Trypanosoma theileri TaxID=67003 RepID=A0A1X0NHD1_9TRYP|nr:uncharacterized protein TM35_000641210 [Trypanosoma theileri]ORC83589.1 hypothetical protein TM35_000641210 [Trypanosoma theileri]
MMMMIRRVMCVLAVVLCCACGCTMTAAADVSSPTAVVPIADESSTAMAFGGGDILRYQMRNKTGFWLDNKASVESTPMSVPHGHESTGTNNLGEGNVISNGHSDAEGRTLEGKVLSEEEELHKTSPQGTGEALTSKVDQTEVVEPPSVSDPTDQQEEKQKQQGLPNRDDSSSLSPTVNTGAGDSSGPGTTTVAGPQSGEKEDTPERLNTPAQPTTSTNSSASAPGESSTLSTSSTNNSNGNSTSGAATGVSARADTEGTNSTTTPKAVPEINSIASIAQKNKGNVDSSSISPVWVRVPLLIVAVLFSVTVY